MRPSTLLALLLLGCTSEPVEPPGDDDDATDPEPTFVFTTPGPEAANPVTFTVRAPEGATSVQYLSQGVTTMGTSTDAAAGFPLTWTFELLGETRVDAWAFAGEEWLDDARIDLNVLPDPQEANDFGLWVEHPDELPSDPEAFAAALAEQGVSRVYVPVGEGLTDCVSTPTLCDHALTDALREHGVSPYAWSVGDESDAMSQAGLLYEAVPAGYHGLVLVADARWDGQRPALEDLALSYTIVRNECDTSGAHLAGEFPIWGAPSTLDAGTVEALDARLDGFFPAAGDDVEATICALRGLGAQRPIHPVFDQPPTEDELRMAGRRAAFRGLKSADLEALDWGFADFEEPACD